VNVLDSSNPFSIQDFLSLLNFRSWIYKLNVTEISVWFELLQITKASFGSSQFEAHVANQQIKWTSKTKDRVRYAWTPMV
jgi:hypothetical protein